MSTERNKQLSREFLAMVDTGNMAKASESFDPSARITVSGQPATLSVNEFKGMGDAFWTAFPGFKHAVTRQVAEGNLVYTHLVFSGVHKGDLNGMPPTGKSVNVPAIVCDEFRNGKIISREIQFDMVGMLQQVGAIPAPQHA